MMDAVKFLKERHRMFKMAGGVEKKSTCDGANCGKCAFYIKQEPFCLEDLQDYEAMEAAIEEWSDEHPRRTYKQDFIEKFPNAPLDKEDNTPTICPYKVGYFSYDDKPCIIGDSGICVKCWNRSME